MSNEPRQSQNPEPLDKTFVSLKTLAAQLDADRSAVRRWLRKAGIAPVVLGGGRNAAIRYDAAAVRAWLAGR